jgi:hypothetical protein
MAGMIPNETSFGLLWLWVIGVVVLGVALAYGVRTHLSLEKDAPISRAVDRAGHILGRPILGGLHHQYARI